MMNPESKTMREFSFTVNKGKSQLTVHLAYDTSAYYSGYFASLSVNGKKPSSSPAALKRIKALKIPVVTKFVDAIGTDVTGAPYDMDTESLALMESYMNGDSDWSDLMAFYRINDEDDVDLEKLVTNYSNAGTERKAQNVVKRFNKSQRLRLIELNRELIREFRELYMEGFEFGGEHIALKFEGLLAQTYNPEYYKRDIDYVRKALVRLYRDVLNRTYKPLA